MAEVLSPLSQSETGPVEVPATTLADVLHRSAQLLDAVGEFTRSVDGLSEEERVIGTAAAILAYDGMVLVLERSPVFASILHEIEPTLEDFPTDGVAPERLSVPGYQSEHDKPTFSGGNHAEALDLGETPTVTNSFAGRKIAGTGFMPLLPTATNIHTVEDTPNIPPEVEGKAEPMGLLSGSDTELELVTIGAGDSTSPVSETVPVDHEEEDRENQLKVKILPIEVLNHAAWNVLVPVAEALGINTVLYNSVFRLRLMVFLAQHAREQFTPGYLVEHLSIGTTVESRRQIVQRVQSFLREDTTGRWKLCDNGVKYDGRIIWVEPREVVDESSIDGGDAQGDEADDDSAVPDPPLPALDDTFHELIEGDRPELDTEAGPSPAEGATPLTSWGLVRQDVEGGVSIMYEGKVLSGLKGTDKLVILRIIELGGEASFSNLVNMMGVELARVESRRDEQLHIILSRIEEAFIKAGIGEYWSNKEEKDGRSKRRIIRITGTRPEPGQDSDGSTAENPPLREEIGGKALPKEAEIEEISTPGDEGVEGVEVPSANGVAGDQGAEHETPEKADEEETDFLGEEGEFDNGNEEDDEAPRKERSLVEYDTDTDEGRFKRDIRAYCDGFIEEFPLMLTREDMLWTEQVLREGRFIGDPELQEDVRSALTIVGRALTAKSA
jgi:hypothetical protein